MDCRRSVDMAITLTLICGLPNAGKTTFSSKFENVLHVDDIGTTEKLIAAIRPLNDVIVEGVFPFARSRRKVAETAVGRRVCIWLDTPLEECKRRENRGRSDKALENASRLFEPPTIDEGWDEIIRIEECE